MLPDYSQQGVEGKEALKNYWTPIPVLFDGMRFPIEQLYAMENPNIVFVKYTGKIKLKNDARFLRKQLLLYFHF